MTRAIGRHGGTVAVVLALAVSPLLMGQSSCGGLTPESWQPLTTMDWGLDISRLPESSDPDENDRWVGTWLVGGCALSAEQPGVAAGFACENKEGGFAIEKTGPQQYLLRSEVSTAAIAMVENGDFLEFQISGGTTVGNHVERRVLVRHLGYDTLVFIDGFAGYRDSSTAELLWTWGQGFYMLKLEDETAAQKDGEIWAGTHPLHVFQCRVAQGSESGYLEVKSGQDTLVIEDRGSGVYFVEGLTETDGGIEVQQVENRLEGYRAWYDPYGEYCEAHCRVFRTLQGIFVARGKAVWDSDRHQELFSVAYDIMAPFAQDIEQ